jgi:ribosomal protein S27E
MKRQGGKFSMPEGYCVKCKARKEIVGAVEETMKNGRKAIKGKCPTCGTVMFKILGGKASSAPAAPAPEAPAPIAPDASKPPSSS